MASAFWSFTLALSLLFTSADASTEAEPIYAISGQRVEVPLNPNLKPAHRVKWTEGSSTLYDSKHKTGNKYSVTDNKSLILPTVSDEDNGKSFTWEIFEEGKKVEEKTVVLRILGKVSKPQVKFTCIKEQVKFTCEAHQTEKMTYQWFEEGSIVVEQKTENLLRASKQLGSKSVHCKISNPVSSESSDPVTHNCQVSSSDDDNLLFGLDFWLMIGILAGGGGLVLVLIVATIICCTINRRKRRLQIKDEQELRLQWSTSANQHQNHDYANQRAPRHAHGHAHGQGRAHGQGHSPRPGAGQTQAPHRDSAGNTGPRPPKARLNRPRPPDPITGLPLPGPRLEQETGQTQLSGADEENPPPLPQPRKKAPRRTQKV